MKLQERVTGDIYRRLCSYYLEGVSIIEYENGSGLNLFSFKELGNLIYEESNNKKRKIQRIYDTIPEEHKASVDTLDQNNNVYNQRLLSEEGLYQFILLMDNPKLTNARKRLSKSISNYRKEYRYTIQDMLSKGMENAIALVIENKEDPRQKFIERLQKYVSEYTHKEILIDHVYTFPYINIYQTNELDETITFKEVIVEEVDEYYIRNIENVDIYNRAEYYIGLEKIFEAFFNLGGLVYKSAKPIIDEELTLYKNDTSLYVKPNNLLELCSKINRGEIKSLSQLKGKGRDCIFSKFILSMYEEKELAAMLIRSVITFGHVNRNYQYTIHDRFYELLTIAMKKKTNILEAMGKAKDKLLEETNLI